MYMILNGNFYNNNGNNIISAVKKKGSKICFSCHLCAIAHPCGMIINFHIGNYFYTTENSSS